MTSPTMLRIRALVLVCALIALALPGTALAQLTGVKTIGPSGNYTTFTAAINDLNNQGVGGGGVIFNVASGNTFNENPPPIRATGTSANTILFQKSGVGTNPLIAPSAPGVYAPPTTIGAKGDGIIIIMGGDYITFDGIDLQDYPGANGTERFEYGYYLVRDSVTFTDACQYVVVRNCTISLDKSTIYSFGIYQADIDTAGVKKPVTGTAGRAERNQFYGNSISNCYGGILLKGYAASSPYDYYDHFTDVGITGSGNTISNIGGGATTAMYGIYAIYQDSLRIGENSVTGDGTAIFYGIYTGTGINSTVSIFGNTLTYTANGTTQADYMIYNATGERGTVTIHDNIVENCTYPGATSGIWYMIYQAATAANIRIFGNIVRNNTKAGTGSMYMIYNSTAASTAAEEMYENQIYGNSNGSGTTYCLYSNPSSGTTKQIYRNLVYTNSATSTIYGLNSTDGSTVEVYKNQIYDLSSSTTSTGKVYGLYVASGTDVTVHNNFISDLRAPDGTNATLGGSVIGLYMTHTSNYPYAAYYNTVYLDASGSNTAFTTTALYASTVPSLALKNNILANASTPGATGRAIAYWRSTTTLSTYAGNTNCFWAGTPSARNLIYYDGTNADQTLGTYQVRVFPQDASSVTEAPPFQDVSPPAPYDLHMQTGTPTQTESGGLPVTGLGDDIDDESRDPNTPDIGADEFGGTPNDLTGPAVTYLPLGDGGTSNRTLTALITDASGVASGGNSPRLYYRKHSDGAYAVDSNPTVNGDEYTWTINYANVGGGSVAVGDTIKYYVAAQDQAGTPNLRTVPPGGAGVNPPGTTAPPAPYFYLIRPVLSGTYTVGLLGNFLTLTAAADTLDGVALTGPVTFSLLDATYPSETFPIVIPVSAGASAANTVTFRPAAGVSPVISGSSASSIFKLNGADYVIIDGSNTGGSSRDMTIINTNNLTNTAAIWLASTGAGAGATSNIIRNLNLAAGADQSTGALTTFGIIACGTSISSTSTSGYDNDRNTYTNNSISKVRYGILSRGVTGNPGTGTVISKNLIGPTDFGSDQIGKAGVVLMHEDSSLVTENHIRSVGGWYSLTSAGTDRTGIGLGNDSWATTSTVVTNAVVTRNKIQDIIEQRSFSAVGIAGLGASGSGNNLIANNVIFNVRANGTGSDQTVGIGIAGGTGDVVAFNSISLYGWIDSTALTAATQSGAGIRITSTSTTNLTLKDNAISVNLTSTTGTIKHYAVVVPSTSYAWGTGGSDFNNYFAQPANAQMVLGGIGTTVPYADVTTLAAWKTQFTPNQDGSSLEADPLYNSARDPQPQAGSPLLAAGTPVPGVAVDYFGNPRGTPPSIGAFESSGDFSAPDILYTALGNTNSTANRTLSPVTVTDPSGVNNGVGLKPRIYYRKTTNTNTYIGNTSATEGWKYEETTSGGSPYSFTLNYSRLFPSGTVTTGDRIEYFVVAQDLAPAPNVGINAGSFATQPVSVALAAGNFPVTGGVNSYLISLSYAGAYNVGTGQLHTTLTGTGGFFNAVNDGVVAGNITVNIVSNITETGAVALNEWAEVGGGPYTMLIQPATTARTLTGSVSGGAVIKLSGAERVTIDGRIGGSGRNLTIENTSTSTTSAAVWVASASSSDSAAGNTVRNCILRGNASTTTLMGIFQGSGTSISTTGSAQSRNSNNTYQENLIERVQYGVFLRGTSTTTLGLNNRVLDNDIGVAGALEDGEASVGRYGVSSQFMDGVVIAGNEIQNIGGASDIRGINMEDTRNAWVTANIIHDLSYTGTSVTKTDGIKTRSTTFDDSANPSRNLFANNVIYNVNSTGTSTFHNTVGIHTNGAYADSFYFNSVYLSGTVAGSTSGWSAVFANGNDLTQGVDSAITVRDNAFFMGGSATGTAELFAHYADLTSYTGAVLSHNDLHVVAGGTATGHVGYVGAANQTTLPAWVAASGEASSISVDPLFNGTANLRPSPGSPLLAAGVVIPSVPTDALGVTRGSPPTIGAYEQAGEFAPPVISYTNLGNTTGTGNRTLTATITDASGVQTGGNGPRLYFRKSTDPSFVWDASPSVAGDNYTFTINHALVGGGGVTAGDFIQYYVAAQDIPGNAITNPTGGSGSSPPGTTPPPVPNSYKIVGAPLTGDYTVGLAPFNEATGRNLTIAQVKRTVLREVPVTDEEETATQALQGESQAADGRPVEHRAAGRAGVRAEEAAPPEAVEIHEAVQTVRMKLVEVEELVPVLVENGKPYTGELSVRARGGEDGPEAVYPTITAALADAVERGISASTRFLLVDAVYQGETWPISIGEIPGAGAGNTITLKPQTGVTPLISANVSQMFVLNGVDWLVIDGSNTPGGTTRDLTIRDSSTTGVPITLQNDATNNTIQHCILEGAYSATPGGVVKFGTGVAEGNSGNTLLHNQLRNRSDVTGSSVYSGIYSSGTTGAANRENAITGNEILNFASYGIYAGSTGNGSGWQIHGNSFYDNTGTTSTTTRYALYFLPGTGSGGHTVSDNFVGGTAPNAGGSALAVGGSFYGIYVSVDATDGSTIEGNTIQNINMTGTGAYSFYGIYVSGGLAEVTGNTVGHASTPNSIVNAGTSNTYCINTASSAGPQVIEDNLVANVSAANTGTGVHIRGIRHTGAATSVVRGNTVHSLTTSSGETGYTAADPAALGIELYPGSTFYLTDMSGNTVYDISCTNAGALGNLVAGAMLTNYSGAFEGNRIYDIRNASTGTTPTTPPIAAGVYLRFYSEAVFANNMIAVGYDQSSNIQFSGIWGFVGEAGNNIVVAHNSISIAGTVSSGSLPTFGILRGDNGTATPPTAFAVLTNAIANTRSGGTGKHYAIGNQLRGTVPQDTGWVSNYNLFHNAAAANLALWGSTDHTLATWQTATGQDANSVTGDPLFAGTTDLHITNPSSPASNAGIYVSVPTVCGWWDYDGEARDALTPDIGADEFGAVTNMNVRVQVAPGWNMISSPAVAANDSVTVLFPGSVFPYVFNFGPGGYQQQYRMLNGPGYWGKFPASDTLCMAGGAIPADTISVNQGWNIVGSVSMPLATAGITSNPPGINTSGNWFRYSNGYLLAAEITPGSAYWVKASQAGVFYFTGGTEPPDALPAKNPLAGLHRITVTDGEGTSQTLSFGSDATGTLREEAFEMPPAPPAGVLDARFEGPGAGLMARIHDASVAGTVEFPILLSPGAYPLTISWSVAPQAEGTAKANRIAYELSDGVGGAAFAARRMAGEGSVTIERSGLTRILLRATGGAELPREFALMQNYPNPFNPVTNIRYALPSAARVTLDVFNVLGQRVRTLVQTDQAAGVHTTLWDGRNDAGQQLASGVYFYRLAAEGAGSPYQSIMKMVLLK
ncbi:MAG: FlgD immunoglobulin-like domain containing protein [Bacteroidota bacterium]